MSVDIDAIDSTTGDGALDAERPRLPRHMPCNNVQEFVRRVMIRADVESGLIRRLRIFGHGTRGAQYVGGGRSPDWSTQVIAITTESGQRLSEVLHRGHLRLLHGYFAQDGVVELHACDVAGGAVGPLLIDALARLWGTRVRGAVEWQDSDHFHRFEGRYYEAVGNLEGRLVNREYHGRMRYWG